MEQSVVKNTFFWNPLEFNENVIFKEIWKNSSWDSTVFFQWDSIRLFCECLFEPQAYATNRLCLFSGSPNWFWCVQTHSITNIGYLVSVWNIYWKKMYYYNHWHTTLSPYISGYHSMLIEFLRLTFADLWNKWGRHRLQKYWHYYIQPAHIQPKKKHTISIWWRLFIGYELLGIGTFHWIQTRLFTRYGQSLNWE